MKFSQQFIGVVDGEIYPRVFEPGETCPPELLEAAKSVGAVEAPLSGILAPDDAKVLINPKPRGRKAKA